MVWRRTARLGQVLQGSPEMWWSRLVFLAGPFLSFWIVEIMNENHIFEDLNISQIFLNLVWYVFLFTACRLVLGRNRPSSVLGSCLAFSAGLLNHYILRFRGRILFPADVTAWRTAANVARGFDYSPDDEILYASALLIAYLFLAWTCAPQRKRAKLPRVVSAILWLVMGGYCFAFFGTDMLPRMGIYVQQWVTQRNGFALNFTAAMRYSSVEKPEDYSQEAVLALKARYPGLPPDSNAVQPARIIVIMNESLADFSIFDSFEASQDPTPFLHSLEENTVKGWMYSPVTGGGTATVEFEYLTGFTSLFQPPHTVAYQLYMEENMPSLAALAGEQGYSTTAFHPYDRSGWNRVIAYQDLSFDKQLYQEDVTDPQYIRRYISDQSDYDTVLDHIAGEDRSFFFNVTMQNHSGYAQGWRNLERTITLPDRLARADRSAQQYFALAQESDKALAALVDACRKTEKPTMIVLFGDHQPPLTNKFYEELYGKKLAERTTEEVLEQYAVPFFIWTNYDTEERQDVICSPNYLGVMTARLAGMPLTGFMQFLWEMYSVIPVVTPVGFVTADGAYVERSQLSQDEQTWLHEYQMLNYCGMVDLFDEARDMFCFT